MNHKALSFDDLNAITQDAVFTVLRENKRVFITREGEPQAILLSYDDFQEISGSTARQTEHTGEGITDGVEDAYIKLLLSMVTLMDNHESYLAGHSERLAIFSMSVARELGCSNETIEDIRWAALLHDIGEILVPAYIFQNQEKLNDQEWNNIKSHPKIGADMVGKVKKLSGVAPIIQAHHERFDGSGYPYGLKGEAIPLGARILAVVDTYDAITNLRLHRNAGNHQKATDELTKNAGSSFDPLVVQTFLQLF